MSAQPLAVIGTGLVTSVGLSAPAACAAIRAGLTNPTETRFIDSGGEWIMSHAVPLDEPLRGLDKLAYMGAMAASECLQDVPREEWERVAVLVCVAERTRPGRCDGLEDRLFGTMCELLDGAVFAPQSGVIPHGRVSIGVALLRARKLIGEVNVARVMIVAADSLLSWPTLQALQDQERLLTKSNSNGFLAGEAASAVLVANAAHEPHLSIDGLGFAVEQASIDKEEPLRGTGLSQAISQSLQDAGRAMVEMDFRITDISGEQYYFKEAALALSRTLKTPKERFDIWHPAECIGEVGSAIGPAMLAVADASARKAYAPGPSILLHAANDAGQRASIVARYVVS